MITLKERWHRAGETRRAVREVETAKWKAEHEAREADINRQAKKLSNELGVSEDTAKRYIKARKVSELRAAQMGKLREKAVKAGKAFQERAEQIAKNYEAAEKQSKKKRGGGYDDAFGGGMWDVGFGTAGPHKKKRKKPVKAKAKRRTTKRKGSGKKRQEIRIIVG